MSTVTIYARCQGGRFTALNPGFEKTAQAVFTIEHKDPQIRDLANAELKAALEPGVMGGTGFPVSAQAFSRYRAMHLVSALVTDVSITPVGENAIPATAYAAPYGETLPPTMVIAVADAIEFGRVPTPDVEQAVKND